MTTPLEQVDADDGALNDANEIGIEPVQTLVEASSLTTAQKDAILGPVNRANSIILAAQILITEWIDGPQDDGAAQVAIDVTGMQQALFNVNAANFIVALSALDVDDRVTCGADLVIANNYLADGIAAAIEWLAGNPPVPPTPPDPPDDALDAIAAGLGFSTRAWGDTFAGPDIDTDNWNIGYMTSLAGGPWSNPPGSPQAQRWEADYAYIDDTFGLVLKAELVDGQWVAGIVQSYGKHPLTGKKLFLAKVLLCTCVNGMWPGFPWGLPDENNTYPPDTSGDLDEIDVQEGGLTGGDPSVADENLYMHFHRTYADAPVGPPTTIPDLSANWGILGWEEDPDDTEHVIWYFFQSEDVGGPVWSPPTTGDDPITTPYNHFIIFNFQVADSSTEGYHTQLDGSTPSPAYCYCREVAVYTP